MAGADGRRRNGGGPRALSFHFEKAREAAPAAIADDDLRIACVAWVAWREEREPGEVWEEVLADG